MRRARISFSCHVSNVVLSSSLSAIRNKISLSNLKAVKIGPKNFDGAANTSTAQHECLRLSP